jgi:hypothetical protein
MIQVTNIKVVLNEGGVNMMEDKHMMEMRVEAKRLFHIGPNLGV